MASYDELQRDLARDTERPTPPIAPDHLPCPQCDHDMQVAPNSVGRHTPPFYTCPYCLAWAQAEFRDGRWQVID